MTTLALGTEQTRAILAVVNAVLLRPLPYGARIVLMVVPLFTAESHAL